MTDFPASLQNDGLWGSKVTRLVELTQQAQKGIVVAGHRGMMARYPENTLLGMQRALDEKVDMIEFDLRVTQDGEVVLIHDETVDRTTDGTGKVHELTLKEIKQLDAGIRFGQEFVGLRVPTLHEFCQLIVPHSTLLLNVEIKQRTKQAVDLSLAILEQYGLMDRCVFCCFDADIVAYLHDAYAVPTQGFLSSVMSNFKEGAGGTYDKMYAAGISMKLITPELVTFLKQKGIQAWAYCPDTTAQVQHAIACGATLLTCNEAQPAMQYLAQQGLRFKP